MYSSRRSAPVTDLHNAHTVSTLMRAMTTSSLAPHASHRHSSRSRNNLNGTLPFRSYSIHQFEDHDTDAPRNHHTSDGDRSGDLLKLEAKLKSKEKIIVQQNSQIDILREANLALEQRLQELTELKRDLSNKQFEERLKNDDLLRDLQDIDRLARKVQADKKYTVEAADRELSEAKMEIEQNHREMEALDTKIAHLNTEKSSLIDELETVKSRYAECNNELIRIQELAEHLQADKTKFSRRISKLVQNEKELLQELQKCRRTIKTPTPAATNGPSAKRISFPVRLDTHFKNIEDERDMYKNEVEILRKLLEDRARPVPPSASPSRIRGRSLSPTAATRYAARRDMAASPAMQNIKRSSSTCATSPTRCTVCGLNRNRMSPTKDIGAYETQLKHLEEERDRFRRELHKYKRSAKDKDNGEGQLIKLMREKEDLQILLNKFERHMAEIQGNIKVLTNERDSLSGLYEQTKDELQKARHELLQSSQSSKISLAAQSILRKVENERDSAILEARTASTERDSLRERLRIATDNGLTERARNEQRIEDLEIDLRKVENDREEIYRQNQMLREQLKELDTKIHEQSFTISQLSQELSEQKAASAQLRYLSEEAERLVQENQRQLSIKKEELRSLEEKNNRLEKKNLELQETNRAIKEDFQIVRGTVQALDKEKDRLGAEIDVKIDETLRLTQEVNSKTRRIEELNVMVSELEAALDRSKDDTKQKLKEISTMRMQLDRNLEEINEYRRKIEFGSRDHKRLQDDLSNLTREHQTIHHELQHAIEDKESLKLQVQEYIKQVSNCENIISQKESDRTALLEQYREASNELNRAKLTLGDLEVQINNLRQDLQLKTGDVKRLTERNDYLEREVQKQTALGKEYEIQLSNMNRSLQRNEDTIKKLQIEKHALTSDFTNVRDMNSTIENKKEQVVRQLASKEIENEQLQMAIGDLKIEIDMLRTQINNEKAVVQSLEEIITSLREKDFQNQMYAQEREADFHLAKDRANMTELKIQTLNKEVAALRSQIIGYETDNKRLKALLTNERYEREKAAQDLRKLTDLTSHIDYESRYRSASPRLNSSPSRTNIHQSPSRSYSPVRGDSARTSPTKAAD